MRSIGLGLSIYQSEKNSIPRQYITDEAGVPILSWRAEVLPYVESPGEYGIDYSIPWNSGANLSISQQSEYRFNSIDGGSSLANILAIAGKGTAWDLDHSVDLDEVSNLSELILIMEIPNQKINWMEPKDIIVDEFLKKRGTIFSELNGTHVTYADGKVAWLNYEDIMNLTQEDFMVQRGGGDE